MGLFRRTRADRSKISPARVRTAGKEDLDTVMALLSAFVAGRAPRRGRARYLKAIRDEQESMFEDENAAWFLAERGAAVVGCARVRVERGHPLFAYLQRPEYGYLFGLYVLPEERNAGTGRLLVERGQSWLRGKGATYCVLHSTPEAIHFYEKLGFEPTWELAKKL